MNFEERIVKIDKEIASAKERGRRIWADFDVDVGGGVKKELNNYYRERGYTIEITPCKSCGLMKADIFIHW
jgi:hypothetical protein